MIMIHDGIEIYCLPETAHCNADEYRRNPLDIEECPFDCEVCAGDCLYYEE